MFTLCLFNILYLVHLCHYLNMFSDSLATYIHSSKCLVIQSYYHSHLHLAHTHTHAYIHFIRFLYSILFCSSYTFWTELFGCFFLKKYLHTLIFFKRSFCMFSIIFWHDTVIADIIIIIVIISVMYSRARLFL